MTFMNVQALEDIRWLINIFLDYVGGEKRGVGIKGCGGGGGGRINRGSGANDFFLYEISYATIQ